MTLPKNFDVTTAPKHDLSTEFKYSIDRLSERRLEYIHSLKERLNKSSSSTIDGFTRDEIMNVMFVIFHLSEQTGFLDTLPPKEQKEFFNTVNKISSRRLRVSLKNGRT